MKVALMAVFTALSLGTNYAMIDIPNVKLMDALIFIAAFLFGLEVGLGSAISIWLVYGFINPYGQADPILLVFLTTGECFYAIAGAFLSRASAARDLLNNVRPYGRVGLLFGIVGFQATFAYDVLTNFGSWIFKTSSLYQALIIGLVTGVPFAIIHEASNIVFFATVVPLAIIASKRMGLPLQNRNQ
jgi:uncharacterized membrane protein